MSTEISQDQSDVTNIGSGSVKGTEPQEEVEAITKKPRSELMTRLIYTYVGLIFVGLLYFTAWANPEIFKLEPETLSVITQFYNALALLLVPFILGVVGAISRVLMAGVTIAKHISVIFSSGLMASFSWLSLKSKVFLALVTPYISHVQTTQVEVAKVPDVSNEFYSMALVAVLVGMFASNIYIAINLRVEKLAGK
jgi:hypothetical protein